MAKKSMNSGLGGVMRSFEQLRVGCQRGILEVGGVKVKER